MYRKLIRYQQLPLFVSTSRWLVNIIIGERQRSLEQTESVRYYIHLWNPYLKTKQNHHCTPIQNKIFQEFNLWVELRTGGSLNNHHHGQNRLNVARLISIIAYY